MNEKRHCPYCNYDLTNTPRLPKIAILSQDDVYPLVNEVRHRSQEHFVTITIDSASNVIGKRIVFIGTVFASDCWPDGIFYRKSGNEKAVLVAGPKEHMGNTFYHHGYDIVYVDEASLEENDLSPNYEKKR